MEFEGNRFEIAYEMIDHQMDRWIVFLHGWGSNKGLMKQAFGHCFEGFNHLYIDLPGFGQSQNHIALKTTQYAQILKIFFESLQIDPLENMIVGHSFGGKVAALLAPKELVLLSSAGIIEPKPLKIKAKIYLAKFVKKIGFSYKGLRSKDANGLNEGMYQTFKNVVDEDFSSIFASLPSKTYIFWGTQDRATSLVSGEKIASLIHLSHFLAFEGDHYFFLKYAKEIDDQIQRWRKSVE